MTLLAGYNFMRKIYTRRIYPNVEGIRNSIRVLTLTNEKFGRFALGYLAYKKPSSPYFHGAGSDAFQFNTVYGAKFVAESLDLRECSRNRVFHWNPYGHRCRLAPWQWQSYCLLVFCPPLGLAACGRADLSVPTEQAY